MKTISRKVRRGSRFIRLSAAPSVHREMRAYAYQAYFPTPTYRTLASMLSIVQPERGTVVAVGEGVSPQAKIAGISLAVAMFTATPLIAPDAANALSYQERMAALAERKAQLQAAKEQACASHTPCMQ